MGRLDVIHPDAKEVALTTIAERRVDEKLYPEDEEDNVSFYNYPQTEIQNCQFIQIYSFDKTFICFSERISRRQKNQETEKK